MSAAKILHDTAMDYYDLAKIAKAKGNLKSHDEYMRKALVIEKEAALKLPVNMTKDFWPYAYLRSAAWMAFSLKQYDEAKLFVQLALAGEPSEFEKERLNELITALKPFTSDFVENLSGKDNSQVLTGFLMSVDLALGQVILQTNETEYRYRVLSQQLQLTPFLLGHLVTVEVIQETEGEEVVRNIRLAA